MNGRDLHRVSGHDLCMRGGGGEEERKGGGGGEEGEEERRGRRRGGGGGEDREKRGQNGKEKERDVRNRCHHIHISNTRCSEVPNRLQHIISTTLIPAVLHVHL